MEIRHIYAENIELGTLAVHKLLGPDAVILDVVDDGKQVEIFATADSVDLGFDTADAGQGEDKPAPPQPAKQVRVPDEIDSADRAPEETLAGETVTLHQVHHSLQEELTQLKQYREKLTAGGLVPEELQAELFLLRKSLKRELQHLKEHRERREAEESAPDPEAERLHARLSSLQGALEQELLGLSEYRAQRIQHDAESDPVTQALQIKLTELQQTLEQEMARLISYREQREALDEEMDPERSRRWQDLAELQACLSSELSQLCEYRLQRAEMDAQNDPVTRALQADLNELQTSLTEELQSLRHYHNERAALDAQTGPRTQAIQDGLAELQAALAEQLERFERYHLARVELDARNDPVTRSLQENLQKLETTVTQEVTALRCYREQRQQFDAESDPVTRKLQANLGKLQQSATEVHSVLQNEVIQLGQYREERRQFDEEANPRILDLTSRLADLEAALTRELDNLRDYRKRRESTDARLDPITTGLHTELTNLQGALRGELVALTKQRKARDELDTSPSPVLLQMEEMRAEQAALQTSLREEISALQQCRTRLLQEHTALTDTLREEIALLRGLRQTDKTDLNTTSPGSRAEPPVLPLNGSNGNALGLAADVLKLVTRHLPANGATLPAMLKSLGSLFSVGDDDILTHGGVVSVLGAAGVGKTTTVAKLAARYQQQHGNRTVALISTDTMQVDGNNLLETFASEQDIAFAIAADETTLTARMQDFADYDLVLIDTAGISKRDLGMADALRTLDGVSNYLVISATAELAMTRHTLKAIDGITLTGAILTKLDEATSMGPALSAIVRHALPAHYTCDGKAIPHNLRPANKTLLLDMAAELALPAAHQARRKLGTE
ncbi:MAG: hypothetical protein ACFHX7_16540 [Pseudomonadota bacterium]